MTPKIQATKGNIGKLDFTKLENFCAPRTPPRKWKDSPQSGGIAPTEGPAPRAHRAKSSDPSGPQSPTARLRDEHSFLQRGHADGPRDRKTRVTISHQGNANHPCGHIAPHARSLGHEPCWRGHSRSPTHAAGDKTVQPGERLSGGSKTLHAVTCDPVACGGDCFEGLFLSELGPQGVRAGPE